MSPGKKAIIVSGTGVVLVLVLVAVFWRDLLVAYHVGVLRGDPDLMTTWIPEPEDSVKGVALRRYLRTRGGSLVLRGRLLAGLFHVLEADHGEFLPGALREGQIVQGGIYELLGKTWLLIDGPSTVATAVPSGDLLALHPLFELVASGDFELEEYPGIHFTTWAYREEVEDRPVAIELRMTRDATSR